MMSDSSFVFKIPLIKNICGFGKPLFKWVEFESPSTLHLYPFIKLLLEPVRKENKYFDRIQLGLHEALVNSVRHGNLCDPKKSLRVRRILTPNWLILQIQDEGEGISKKERICNLPIQLDTEKGRGLFLIRKCFDDVRWSQKGNRIQLACRR